MNYTPTPMDIPVLNEIVDQLQAEKQDLTTMLNHNAERIVTLEKAIEGALALMEDWHAEPLTQAEKVLEQALKGDEK